MAEDVTLATKYGLGDFFVSNHRGRQLDGTPATLDPLRECAATAGGMIPVAVDGDVRRGTDIFKAINMGATHCLVGRMSIWGLVVCFSLPFDATTIY